MARPEKPITSSGALAQFAADLRQLRREAGSPPYRRLAEQAHYAPATLAAAASGRTLPSREVTEAYVRACGGHVAGWDRRWRDLATRQAAPQPPPPRRAPVTPRLRRAAASRAVQAILIAALIGIPLSLQPNRDGPDRSTMRGPAAPSPAPTEAPTPASVPVQPLPPTSPGAPTQPRAPQPAVRTRPTTPPAAVPVVQGNTTWTGLAGYRCPAQPGATADDDRVPKGDGWHESGGGWAGDGCTGTAVYTATTTENDHWQETMTWTFRPGRALRCDVDVYVPAANGNGRAHYDVYGPDPIDYPRRIGQADLDQPANRGRWARLGTWTAPGGVLQVRLTDRPARDGAAYRIAASATRLTCR